MTDRSEQIASFWEFFAEQEPHLSRVQTNQDPALDGLLLSLHRIDPKLFFMLSSDAKPHEFVLTVEGDSTKYALAEAVIAAAPKLPNWTFRALVPAMGFGFRTEYEGFEIDPASLWFLPLESRSNPSSLGLRVGIPRLDPAKSSTAKNAVLTFLDSALG